MTTLTKMWTPFDMNAILTYQCKDGNGKKNIANNIVNNIVFPLVVGIHKRCIRIKLICIGLSHELSDGGSPT